VEDTALIQELGLERQLNRWQQLQKLFFEI
jgi:hypothetical protein